MDPLTLFAALWHKLYHIYKKTNLRAMVKEPNIREAIWQHQYEDSGPVVVYQVNTPLCGNCCEFI